MRINGLGKLIGAAFLMLFLSLQPVLAQTQQERSDQAFAAFNKGDYNKAYSLARPLADEGFLDGGTGLLHPG